MHRLLPALVTVALLLGACSARVPSNSPLAPSASPDPSQPAPSEPPATPTATAAATPTITDAPAPSDPPPSPPSIARLCTPPPQGEVDPIDCSDAIEHAIGALGPDAGRAAVAWYRHGLACPPNARCIAPPPGTGHVVVLFADGPVVLVPVQLTADGYMNDPPTAPSWDIWGPVDATPGAPEAPDLGPAAPAELRDRAPLPLCGLEDDIPNPVIRGCFHQSVRANRAAEFITGVAGPDGNVLYTVHRYEPGGPVVVYRDRTHEGGAWTKEDCALETVADELQLFIDAHCLTLPIG